MTDHRIDAQGIYVMREDVYHSDPVVAPSLSSGVAKLFTTQSAAHAFAAHPRLNPAYVNDDGDKRLDIGSVAHKLLLEPQDSSRVIVVVEADDWRTKAAKEARDAAYASHKIPILACKLPPVLEMMHVARAFIERTEIAGIFEESVTESVLVWKDKHHAWCRCRPDILTNDRRIMVDYKTCDTVHGASPLHFPRSLVNMGYDFQAQFYSRGAGAIFGTDLEFLILAQEISPPYACALFGISAALKEIAAHRVDSAIYAWHRCLTSGEWPAYEPRIHYAEPPAYMMNDYARSTGEWA